MGRFKRSVPWSGASNRRPLQPLFDPSWRRHPPLCDPDRSRGICSVRNLDLEAGSLFIQDLAGNDKPLNLAGTFADGAKLDVAVELLHWVVLDKAVPPVELHRLITHPHRYFAGHQLSHR